MFKKGVVIAATVAAGMALTGCASQGSAGACGEPTAVPVAAPAPAPMNTCKNMSSCKHKVTKKHVRHHHVAKTVKETTTTTSDK